jgi:hypothetical protein
LRSSATKPNDPARLLGFAALNANLPTHARREMQGKVEITMTEDRQGTLVNGKPGYVLQLPLKNERMLCYAISASNELVCNDSGAY